MIGLLDVNVLVALAWPNHVHHASAVRWYGAHRDEGWATCPLTESGFLRVSSNRRVIPTARGVAEAVDVLRRWRQQPGHAFWTDDVSLADCPEVDIETLTGYRQVTDAHLLALAVRRGGRLVTFDAAAAALDLVGGRVELLTLL